ncbi:MAG: hypothetical protein F4X94_03050, partial [Dehalococcoidia bacterium]|nr:hypothetical protein [Dehalococcoidia bacterium]
MAGMMTIALSGTVRRSLHLVTALFVLCALSACGGGNSRPSMTAQPDGTVTPVVPETDAANARYGAIAWQEDEVHATFIPSGPDEDGWHLPFPPGVRYRLYQGVAGYNDQAPVIGFGPARPAGARLAP